MWELWLRVPTKGWKLVRAFKDKRKAVEAALGFQPLEVKLCDTKRGAAYYGSGANSNLQDGESDNSIGELAKTLKLDQIGV